MIIVQIFDLRDTEEAIRLKSEHLEKLKRNLIERSLEVENLRRAYKETKEKFESEKRLNKMIKLRKVSKNLHHKRLIKDENRLIDVKMLIP